MPGGSRSPGRPVPRRTALSTPHSTPDRGAAFFPAVAILCVSARARHPRTLWVMAGHEHFLAFPSSRLFPGPALSLDTHKARQSVWGRLREKVHQLLLLGSALHRRDPECPLGLAAPAFGSMLDICWVLLGS